VPISHFLLPRHLLFSPPSFLPLYPVLSLPYGPAISSEDFIIQFSSLQPRQFPLHWLPKPLEAFRPISWPSLPWFSYLSHLA